MTGLVVSWVGLGGGVLLLCAGAYLERRNQDRTIEKRAGRIRTGE